MGVLVKKEKRTYSGGEFIYRTYYINHEGEPIEKECYTCQESKPLSKYGKGKGLLGIHNECNDCILSLIVETSQITIRGMDLLEKELENNPGLRFAPKYDSKDRRWLYFYEKDDFRKLALSEGWNAVKKAYDVNQFVYSLLRKELFTPDEIKTITKLTKNKL